MRLKKEQNKNYLQPYFLANSEELWSYVKECFGPKYLLVNLVIQPHFNITINRENSQSIQINC